MADVIDTALLDKLIAEMPERVDSAIRQTGFQVEAKAKELVLVDTGATRNSGFTETSKGSRFALAAAAAEAQRPGVGVANGTPGIPPKMTAYVSFATDYALWIELIYKPFLGPATELADGLFEQNLRKELPQG